MRVSELQLRTEDGFSLAGTLIQPSTSNGVAVQLNGAAQTPRRYYRAFAEHLAARGFTVLIYEVRGAVLSPGESARQSPASMLAWGRFDQSAAGQYLLDTFPELALAVIGHSIGGQLIGLSPLAGAARAILLVACADGYWKRSATRWPARLRRGIAVHVTGPALLRVLGYLPSFVVGGTDKPSALGREVLRFSRSPHFFCDERGRPLRPHHAEIRALIRQVAVEDDEFAPPGTELNVHERYPNARGDRQLISPAQYGIGKIGHLGLFHRSMPPRAWDDIASWLEAAALGFSEQRLLERSAIVV